MEYHNGAKTFKMSARRTRSSSLGITTPVVAKPFKKSRRKKQKNLSESEKQKVGKHEIKGSKFTYRLRSVKDILKNVCDEAEKTDQQNADVAKKNRRRSNLKGGKRKSIVENVLMKNFQMSVREANNNSMQEEKEVKDNESSNICNAVMDIDENDKSKKPENDETEVVEKPSDEETSSVQKGDTHAQMVAAETKEEINAREEAEKKGREKTMEIIKKLLEEQSKWAELYESCQKKLEDAKRNADNETTSSVEESHLSEEQRDFLNGRINAQEFCERLQTYQTEYIHYARRVQDFTERMQNFKHHITEYLKSSAAPNILTPEKDKGFETPRRLISKIVQGVSD